MDIFFTIVVLFFSVIMHEVAHGSMAQALGDHTAKNAGRLSLNPLVHIDLVGSIILPLMLILARSPFVVGWAKPVPVNPYNFTDQKWGELKVSIAGPGVNLIIALIFGLSLRLFALPENLVLLFATISFYNIMLAIFNLLPVPPLDGSHILFSFFPKKMSGVKFFLEQYGLFIFVLLILSGVIDWVFLAARIIAVLITGQS